MTFYWLTVVTDNFLFAWRYFLTGLMIDYVFFVPGLPCSKASVFSFSHQLLPYGDAKSSASSSGI